MVKFQIKGIVKLRNRIKKIADNIEDSRPALEKIGKKMVSSIRENFKKQGRPDKWKPLSPVTLAMRRKRGNRGRRILIDTTALFGSIDSQVVDDKSVAAGTDKKYANRQQFGWPGGIGRGRSKTPARPFVLFQDEDIDAIGRIFSRHARKK